MPLKPSSTLITLISSMRVFYSTLILCGLFLYTPECNALAYAESLNSMIARADLIFVGTLKEIKTFSESYVDHPYTLDPKKAKTINNLITENVFRVDQVLKGEITKRCVGIRQLGGFNAGVLASWSNSYFPKLEKHYVVIAIAAKEYQGKLVSTSGGQGVFEINERDGISYLKSLNQDKLITKGAGSEPTTGLEVPMSDFLKMVKEEGKGK